MFVRSFFGWAAEGLGLSHRRLRESSCPGNPHCPAAKGLLVLLGRAPHKGRGGMLPSNVELPKQDLVLNLQGIVHEFLALLSHYQMCPFISVSVAKSSWHGDEIPPRGSPVPALFF